MVNPQSVPKVQGALRFGILGAANIGPMALIDPAKTHPDVVILAVAARNKARADAYAKKHGINKVHTSYEGKLCACCTLDFHRRLIQVNSFRLVERP
jgi:hypothetical protein